MSELIFFSFQNPHRGRTFLNSRNFVTLQCVEAFDCDSLLKKHYLISFFPPAAHGNQRSQEQSFQFYLTPYQANEIAYNREIIQGQKAEYTVQVPPLFVY